VLIKSSEIPQADLLNDVIEVIKAVSKGARTFQDIAEAIGKVERQGRYYRLAAEILGFLKNEQNHAELTPLGRKYLTAEERKQNQILFDAVLSARIFQRMIPFFEKHREGITREQLEHFLSEVTQAVGPSMMPRRVSTILNWLETVKAIKEERGVYRLRDITETTKVLKFADTEPVLPRRGDLREYQEVEKRTSSAGEVINVMRSQVAQERSNNAHRQLVNLVAERLSKKGILPRANQLIDLAAEVDSQPYIFEMKSTTAENARSQVRIGLSQLHEYRYLQDLPHARLILVIENRLPGTCAWMEKYMEEEQHTKLIWDGENQLFASVPTKESLAFLWSV